MNKYLKSLNTITKVLDYEQRLADTEEQIEDLYELYDIVEAIMNNIEFTNIKYIDAEGPEYCTLTIHPDSLLATEDTKKDFKTLKQGYKEWNATL